MMTRTANPSDVAVIPAGAAVSRRGAWQGRFVPAILLLAFAAPLALALALRPNPAGQGTHTQLGIPPCGIYAATGIPCPSCGMTTAFAHAVRGQLFSALHVQPMGAVLALGCAAGVLVCGYALVWGLPLNRLGRWLFRPGFLIGMGGGVILAWVYKILLVSRVLP
jgi:hypothetical protein